MVNYYVFKSKDNRTDKNSYGICACSVSDGVLEIKSSVYNLPDDIEWLKALSDKLNNWGVDPVHLRDIVEDELYVMSH